MWDKLKYLKRLFTFTLFLQSPTKCRREGRKFWRKIESNASVLVPKGYEPILGQISIESQNMIKINFYELVFLDVTQGTFIHIGFLNYTTSCTNGLAEIGYAPCLDIHESSREPA